MQFLKNVRRYCVNRFVDETHVLPTRLKKGVYHEMHDRVLHASFEALVDWVEIECASFMAVVEGRGVPLFNNRNPADGMTYLERMIESDDEHHVLVTASELYLWWYDRKTRQDPWTNPADPEALVDWRVAEAQERAFIKEDQEMLRRLAGILNDLWT